MSDLAGSLQGVVLMTRHGDRTKFYQDPNSYTGSETHITPLGEIETYETGQYLRSRYVAAGASDRISGISPDTINLDQCTVTADAAAESNVIVISAYSMWQGIYPATPQSNVTLANGTTVTSPLNGQQYLPIETVEFEQLPLLEAFTSCPAYTDYLTQFYASPAYAAKSNASASFLKTLGPVVDARSTKLKDMYNVYDYVNVNNIYNATFAQSISNTSILSQSSDIANWLSYYSFSGPSNASAGNIAGRGMMGELITSMRDIANASTDSKIQHYSLSYKPFLSLFNMTGAAQADPNLAGIVAYSSVLAFELRDVQGDTYVNMVFRNGSSVGTQVQPVPLLGRGQVKMSDFVSAFNATALYTTLDWCRACNQTGPTNGCDGLLLEANATALARVNAPQTSTHNESSHFSAVGAGFIGAVCGIVLATVVFLVFARRQKARLTSRGGKVTISSPVQMDDYDDTSKNPFR